MLYLGPLFYWQRKMVCVYHAVKFGRSAIIWHRITPTLSDAATQAFMDASEVGVLSATVLDETFVAVANIVASGSTSVVAKLAWPSKVTTRYLSCTPGGGIEMGPESLVMMLLL
jgi:hypothetical protein